MRMKIGFVPIARSTFDTALAAEVTGKARSQLEAAGFMVCAAGEGLVSSMEEADAAAQALASQPLDLLLIFQATFADSTMTMHVAEDIEAPLLLWAVPEARTGGRLRLNSLCGINLAGHALTRAGRRYDYAYAPPGDPSVVEKADILARAGRALRRLHTARIGRIGEHPGGFESCIPHPEQLKARFGLEVVQIELAEVFQAARRADPSAVDAARESLSARVDGLDRLDPEAARGTLGAYLAMQAMAERDDLHGLAVRCWPEFFTDLGCAACGALSLLNDEYIPCSCEADVNGTITQLMLQAVSGAAAFGTDVVDFDTADNFAVVWHCGQAPLAMADPQARPGVTVHSNRKLPLLMEFALKPGRVTVARLSEATGEYRLVVGGGEMLRRPLSFSGTAGTLRFDRPAAEVLDTIMREGLEHHLALTYGDYVPALVEVATQLNIPVLHL